MAITYHAGRRIQGTSTDFGTAGAGIAGVSGGWKELGRTTLGSAGDTISVASLPDKRYYMILSHAYQTGGATEFTTRFNSDTGANYSSRGSSNGASDNTGVSKTYIRDSVEGVGADIGINGLYVGYVSNLSTKEKLLQTWTALNTTAGAGTAPSRTESVGKHAQTSNPIDEITLTNIDSGSYDTDSEVVVLGWDPADTHTTNFWEELGTDTWTSGDSISVSFTAKKYIMFSWWLKHNGSVGGATSGYVGSTTIDTGSNYANRISENGSADGTNTSQGKFTYMGGEGTGGAGQTNFGYGFAINNASNEKLFTWHQVENQDAGAANAPKYRSESVGKWANTSNQFDIMTLTRATNDLAGGELRVWGSN